MSITRIYPEAKTGLINWIEENFHEIDSFVASFTIKDGTSMTIYHTKNTIEAFGILGIANATLVDLANSGGFIPKEEN